MNLFDVYPLYDVTPVNANGLEVVDENGQQYLDFYGGHAVISIGHSHPHYISSLTEQLQKIGFYSNAVKNPLQLKLASKLGRISGLDDYQLFLCNSGAEANENALKLASFHTGKKRVLAFHNSFHGRTSAAVAATDNSKIKAPINAQHQVTFLPFDDEDALEAELKKGDVCGVIFESIQGVGGLDEPNTSFLQVAQNLCEKNAALLIADEVQSGFGRSGKFFAFQHHKIQPHIISMAKGMGNGFPVGGILIHKSLKASHGLLGTTFGGNYLACTAVLAVLEVLEKEHLLENTVTAEKHFREAAGSIPQIKKIKGRGLMLGLEFDFNINELRKQLIYEHHIFTGGATNPNILRILPPLTCAEQHIDTFFKALKTALSCNTISA